MNFIRLYYDNKDYIKAFENLEKLKKYHPESQIFQKQSELFSEINEKARILQDSIDKVMRDSIKLANINELGKWRIGNIINEFGEPTGDHYIILTLYGTFKNTATVGSILRVDCVGRCLTSRKYDYSLFFEFDEYDNGTYERERPVYTKIVNKQLRKIYTAEYSTIFKDLEGKDYKLEDILLEEGIYEFEIRFEYKTIYYFTIDTRYINNALVKAGLMSIDDIG